MLTPLALKGTGIAYQFAHQVDPWLETGQLVQLLKEWTPAFPGFYVYYPSRKQMASPLRAFIDYLLVPSAANRVRQNCRLADFAFITRLYENRAFSDNTPLSVFSWGRYE